MRGRRKRRKEQRGRVLGVEEEEEAHLSPLSIRFRVNGGSCQTWSHAGILRIRAAFFSPIFSLLPSFSLLLLSSFLAYSSSVVLWRKWLPPAHAPFSLHIIDSYSVSTNRVYGSLKSCFRLVNVFSYVKRGLELPSFRRFFSFFERRFFNVDGCIFCFS